MKSRFQPAWVVMEGLLVMAGRGHPSLSLISSEVGWTSLD